MSRFWINVTLKLKRYLDRWGAPLSNLESHETLNFNKDTAKISGFSIMGRARVNGLRSSTCLPELLFSLFLLFLLYYHFFRAKLSEKKKKKCHYGI
ncbi:hypothetical protein GDO81_011031 [Engystomops pustulosus]|uniref:Uncharacterized protein n=1 Tax=Engystomops pustulosus TaxID=76066 RepID=A0AAV7C456_ENGPU|nr:hypothetical protein GDO81_011031 [Engystomops pustulosus]